MKNRYGLLAVALVALGCQAQDKDAVFERVYHELGTDEVIAHLNDVAPAEALQQVLLDALAKARGRAPTDAEKAELLKSFDAAAAGRRKFDLAAARKAFRDTMMSMLSLSDLEAALAFYTTPAGKRVHVATVEAEQAVNAYIEQVEGEALSASNVFVVPAPSDPRVAAQAAAALSAPVPAQEEASDDVFSSTRMNVIAGHIGTMEGRFDEDGLAVTFQFRRLHTSTKWLPMYGFCVSGADKDARECIQFSADRGDDHLTVKGMTIVGNRSAADVVNVPVEPRADLPVRLTVRVGKDNQVVFGVDGAPVLTRKLASAAAHYDFSCSSAVCDVAMLNQTLGPIDR